MAGEVARNDGKLRYGDLTQAERAAICNGCGAKGGRVPVPDFIFTASCDHHDFNYWLGYREEDRAHADRQFYDAMKADVASVARFRRPLLHFLAWRYYRAVRRWGAGAFHFGERERTREDLAKEMAKRGGHD